MTAVCISLLLHLESNFFPSAWKEPLKWYRIKSSVWTSRGQTLGMSYRSITTSTNGPGLQFTTWRQNKTADMIRSIWKAVSVIAEARRAEREPVYREERREKWSQEDREESGTEEMSQDPGGVRGYIRSLLQNKTTQIIWSIMWPIDKRTNTP